MRTDEQTDKHDKANIRFSKYCENAYLNKRRNAYHIEYHMFWTVTPRVTAHVSSAEIKN